MTLIILLYALFASSFSMGKVLLRYTTPIFLTGIRMLIGGLILLAYQYLSPRQNFYFKKKHIWLFLQIVLFGVYFNYILRFWALQSLPSSKTAFLYNLAPFMSAIYSYYFFKERMTRGKIAGLAIGFLGMIPILLTSSSTEKSIGEMFFISLPELAVIASVALHAYSWVVMRKLVRDKNYSPTLVNGITMAAGGFMALLTSFAYGNIFPVTKILPFSGWLAAVIIISNIICFNLYGSLLKKYSATFLSFAGFLAPLFAALYGWGFLGETITWQFYASSVLVFVGLYIFYREETKDIENALEE
ncbi:DMT family transporter [Candidatus Dependentiae bacterium]